MKKWSLLIAFVLTLISTNTHARFTQADTWMGTDQQPITLNKYAYGNTNPVNYIDPTGNASLMATFAALNGQQQLALAVGASISVGAIMYGISRSETVGNSGANSRGWGVWDIVARNRFTAARGISGTGVVAATNTKTQRMNDGHHTIPIYLCGGDDQEKSLLDQKSHLALHSGLRAIQVSMHGAEAAADRMIAFKGVRTGPVLSLADSEFGRGIIANGIHGYYSVGGWMQRGVRPIGMIFPTEKARYVSGENTSLGNPEVCKRKG